MSAADECPLLIEDCVEFASLIGRALAFTQAARDTADVDLAVLHLNSAWAKIARALAMAPDAKRRALEAARAKLEKQYADA